MPRELSVEFDLIRYKSGGIGGGFRYRNVYGGWRKVNTGASRAINE